MRFYTKHYYNNYFMKIIYLFSISSLLMITGAKASAQKINSVKPFEVEISVGGTYGIGKYVGENQFGPAFAIEGRYNFPQTPIDLGLEIYGGSTTRKYEDSNLSNRILSLTTYSDYNFMRGKKFSPFIGVGVGIASCKVVQGYYGNDAVKAIFTPRIGIEIFNHFRVTAYSKLGYRGYNNWGISVGYAFGGGRQ
jgi:hypothetical protein